MITVSSADKTIEIFGGESAAGGTPTVLLITGGESARGVWEKYSALSDRPCRLAAVEAEDWENGLSPWPAPKVFRGGSDFGAGADDTVKYLEKEIVPALAGSPDGDIYIAGYSLAGLFALYALYRTDVFRGAISASGSLWFPGFAEFAAGREPVRKPDKIYLSLGDREKNTKNTVMGRVEEKTKEIYGLFRASGTDCVLCFEPGGHFSDPEGRLARGIAWLTDNRI